MSEERTSHLRREMLASAGINAIFSLAFFALVFGFRRPVTNPGIGNYAFDFIPQSFAIGLMASLIPCLLASRAIRLGRLPGSGRSGLAPLAIARLSLAMAGGSAAIGLALALLVGSVGPDQVSLAPALLCKLGYGAVLGAIVTRTALSRALPTQA